MKRRYLATVIAVGCLSILAACATPTCTDKMPVVKDGQWWLSFERAQAEALETGKPMMVNFSAGHDDPWGAPWCWKLNQEVFEENLFKAWAKENVVPVLLEYPFAGPQDEATKKANAELAAKYGVDEYPYIIFMKPDGTQMGILGYGRGGAQPWIAEAEKILDANE